MQAGDLRERIRFERREEIDDGYGNVVGEWVPRFERSAAFLMRPGNEAVTAARLAGTQPVTIIVRSDEETRTVGPAWRAVDARTGCVFDIKAAEDMNRRRQWFTLECVGEAS